MSKLLACCVVHSPVGAAVHGDIQMRRVSTWLKTRKTAIQTVFHHYEGLWEATDTTVSYSCGISFHWEKGKAQLRGTRLKAGPRTDAIILSGEADVELVDSDFPIGLGVCCNQGAKTDLSLLPGDSITATNDRCNLLPGVNWRLKIMDTRVERWFLFLRRIGAWQPPAEITLASSKDMIVSLFVHNLEGETTLSNDLAQPLSIGNLTLKRSGDDPAGISMYALYFSSNETDATISGRTHICEWMQGAVTVRVQGINRQQDLTFGCTTLELSGDVKLVTDRVHFGRAMTWQPENNLGEANVTGNASLKATNISVNRVEFRTEDDATVSINGVERLGELIISEEGSKVKVDDALRNGRTSVENRKHSACSQGRGHESCLSQWTRSRVPTRLRRVCGAFAARLRRVSDAFQTAEGLVTSSTTKYRSRTTLTNRTSQMQCSSLDCSIVAAATIALSNLSASAAASREKAMNVLFLVADDLNSWLLEDADRYAGKVVAPNLRKLASGGVNFTRAYTAAPVRSPSRTTFFSGVAPWKSGIYNNAQTINSFRSGVPSLPDMATPLPNQLQSATRNWR